MTLKGGEKRGYRMKMRTFFIWLVLQRGIISVPVFQRTILCREKMPLLRRDLELRKIIKTEEALKDLSSFNVRAYLKGIHNIATENQPGIVANGTDPI